jgi:ribonuclease P protein component
MGKKGSSTSLKKNFPTHCRVRHSWEYGKIQRSGRRIKLKSFTVLYETRKEGPVRLGLVVSRKVGGAVQRNRVKRLVREFFRQNQEKFPEHRDFVIVAKKGADKLTYTSVAGELKSLFLSKHPNPEGGSCWQNR